MAHTAATGLVDPEIAIGFGALIAVGELARLTMPGNREVAPIGAAAALGYTLLLDMGGVPARHSALQVVAVLAVGMVTGALPHLAVGRPPRLDAMARRLLTGALLALVYRPLAGPLFTLAEGGEGNWWPALGAMALLILVMVLVDVLLAAVLRAEQVRAAFGVVVRDEMRMAAPLGAAVAASGILLALASHSMDMAALLVFAAPLLVTQVAFRKYAGIRATYLQTVRALSRVTEVGGYVEPGHSRRVSRLAVAVGRELGMAEPELLELEYAALMHDIGQLSLRRPDPRRRHGAHRSRAGAAHRRTGRGGDPADRGAGPGGRDRPPSVRHLRRDAAAGQPHHQGGQRLRRPGRRFHRQRPGRARLSSGCGSAPAVSTIRPSSRRWRGSSTGWLRCTGSEESLIPHSCGFPTDQVAAIGGFVREAAPRPRS